MILRDARKNPAPVYLFTGEPYQTEALARRLIEILVPAEKRSVNLEPYEGGNAPLTSVLVSCRTLGLFGGGKVVWMREPAFLASSEKRSDISAAMFSAWAADRRKQAADKLLLLAALAGWSQDDFDTAKFSQLNKTKTKALFGREIDGNEAGILDQLRTHAAEAGLTLASHQDESGQLEDFLDSGTGGDSVLVFTSESADHRKRIVKELQKRGITADLEVDRERSGAMTSNAVEILVDESLAEHAKRMSPSARKIVIRRAGGDPGQLNTELEKLCLFAADKETIDEEDVRIAMRDLGESWIFDFTRALAQRNVTEALYLMRGLFAQGEPPLRLLAMIAREVRILLAAREILSTTLARAWSDGTTFNRFRDQMLPQIPDEQKHAVGGTHPYVLYLALQNAARTTTPRLRRALLDLHDLDITFKSTRADPQIRLEAFVLDLVGHRERP